MIVRDEAGVIRRALTSAIPFIDTWLIVDTGSKDATCRIVRETMKGRPGTLLRSNWKGFADSRNEALVAARTRADYVLFLDADDFLVGDPQQTRAKLGYSDLWLCWAYAGWVRHARTFAIRSDLPATWVGDRHESLNVQDGVDASVDVNESVLMRYMHQGFRSKGESTFELDISALENERRTGTAANKCDAARAQFYIARSYHAAGDFSNAAKHYLSRALDASGDEEERWYADFQACLLSSTFNCDAEKTLQWLAQLSLIRPTRAEALIEMASLLRQLGDRERALKLGHYCASMPISSDRYFVDISCYRWRAWSEIAINLRPDARFDQLRKRYALRVLSLPGVHSHVRLSMRKLIDESSA